MRRVIPAILLVPLACAPAEEPASRSLTELERLTFVPAVAYSLRPDPFFRTVQEQDLAIERPLLMDLFEVTRRDVAYYRDHTDLAARDWAERILALDPRFFEESRLDWPAFLSFEEAARFAELRGMRLPTASEWIHVAVGRADRYYPWGRDQSSVANTVETGLGRPTPVGTFESGRAITFGCYDLVGNVWEWVTGSVPGYDDVDDQLVDIRFDSERALAMGGGFNSQRRQTYEWRGFEQRYRFHALRRDRRTLSPSIGARMVADAEDYLWEQASSWGSDESAQRRVSAVGRRWAGDATAHTGLRRLLEELLAREGAPRGLEWLVEGLRLGRADLAEAD